MPESARYYGRNNNELIQHLKTLGAITKDRVFEAMLSVDRAKYVTSTYANVDAPSGIGAHGVTMFAAREVAHILELLEDKLKPGNKVLIADLRSGYLVACAGAMLGNEGLVVGINDTPEVVVMAKRNILEDRPDLLASGRVVLHTVPRMDKGGDWIQSIMVSKHGLYDAIYTASFDFQPSCRHSFIDRLARDCRVIIAGEDEQVLYKYYKTDDGGIDLQRKSWGYRWSNSWCYK